MTTPLDALVEALCRAGDYNPAAEAPPEAVLWCDERQEFAPLLPMLRARLPQLLTCGPYDPKTRTGPAVWLRPAVARAVPEATWAEGVVPIVYVPDVSRDVLRNAPGCPELLKLLVWLGVVGTFFGHVNGKDWTLRGFLAGERGPLRLDVPDDTATRAALALAATRLFVTPIESLLGRRLDAEALHALLAPDLAADMLDWLDGTFDATADPARFAAFAAQAAKTLGFDPATQSRHDGAVRLAAKRAGWDAVWARFETSGAAACPGIMKLLDVLEPPDLLADRKAYPRLNARGEEQLRAALPKLAEMSASDASTRLAQLEAEHAWRRDTVWARRGAAPLAQALEHLAAIAAAPPLPSHDAVALAAAYAERGWRADLAALRALAAVPRALDRAPLVQALRAVYLPWLEQGAQALQELARAGKVPLAKPAAPAKGDTLLFVDGLRMDLAQRLLELLRGEGAEVSLSWRWSGFPTVTATCKPLVSPVAKAIHGAALSPDLAPVTGDGRLVRKPVLDKLLEQAGWTTTSTLFPEGKLWSETGSFDAEGHALGAALADRAELGLRNVADRALALARAGRRVRIITDHGWLLLPGGLEVAPLDAGLVEPQGKRSRCALVKPDAPTTYLQLPWSWNAEARIAVATGARAFIAGQEYAHGGVSPQECILPMLEIAPLTPARRVDFASARWEGLRLRIEVAGGADLRADLRLGPDTSGKSLIKGGRVLDEAGRTSVLVSDVHEGKKVCLVVLDEDDAVLATRTLIVGAE